MKGKVAKWLPGAAVIFNYDRANFRHDLLASLVVSLVLLPSAFAYADLAKCAPAAGLYAAVVGMVVYALFTSSRHVNVGPDAAIALLVGAAIGPLAAGDPGKAVTLATVLSFLTAGVLFLMAKLRLGIAADFLSSPAMLGFMNGAAAVIVGSQLGKFCGINLEKDNTLLRFWEWAGRIGETDRLTLGVGLVCIVVLAICKWGIRRVPGAVAVFLLAMIAGQFCDFSAQGLAVIGTVDLRVPKAVRPDLALADMTPLFTGALGIALLVFSEGVVLGRSVARRNGYEIDADRELIAFGASNAAAGLVFSFPIGSSQTRTLLNDATGGRTQMVNFLAAGMSAGFVFLAAPWIAKVPSVAIASILVFTGITLIDMRVYKRLWKLHRFSMIVAAVTTIGVLGVGVLPGILLGVLLSLLGVLANIVRPNDALLGCVEGSETLHDVGDDSAAKTIPGLVVYRFYGPLIFANVRFFIERVEKFIRQEKNPVKQLIVDARAIPSVDITAAEQLHDFLERLRARGIEVVVAKAHLPLRETMSAVSGKVAPESKHYEQLAAAVAAYRQQPEKE
ncbi:SulP family inorganic anion transporter [Haloferula chungangensis]|uniref:SulP family inorganic anion transporter n=1 Tax=Haloferula chungangensis TaxID=1048331 RepID=A0ABW2L9T3_9BACT